MSERSIPSDLPSHLRSCAEFWDIYITTQGGTLRRVTITKNVLDIAAWLLQPGGASGPEMDKLICEEADQNGCGYGEAFVGYMLKVLDDEVYGECYRIALSHPEELDEGTQRFCDDQAEKEKVWRTAHNDWRDPLPPALD